MPAKSTSIFSNKDTRTWVQADGVGTTFSLYGCHALTNWSRDYGETSYVKCKSPDEYGKFDIKETIPGSPDEPTFTVVAFTSQEADFILGVDCPVDWQVFYGSCSSPSDATGYTKIRHFYQASKSSESEDAIDFIGEEEFEGIQLSSEWTCEDIVEILATTVTASANGVTETQAFNDIAMLREARCEGDCGAEIKACYWGCAVADASYGAATANVWYTSDGAATWTVCATDPFASNAANISSCVILAGTTTPRIIVFRGNVFSDYGARASITDDWGASWTEVDMGGNANGSYVNGAFKYSDGLIWCVGNGGYMYYSEDRGDNWTEVTNSTSGVSVELWDIHSPDGVTFYAVGDANTCIKSTDSGVSWAATSDASPAASSVSLFTVQAPTEYRVLIGGEIDTSSNCLWYSDDGGVSWNDLDFTGSTTASGEVRRIRLADKAERNHWVFIHGVNNGATARYGAGTNFRFFRTLDGGGSFERQNLVTNNGLNGLSVCTINKAFAAGEPLASGIAAIQKMAT